MDSAEEKVVYPLPVIWPADLKKGRSSRAGSSNPSSLTENDPRMNGHRRSSIPFYGRSPKVSFDQVETQCPPFRPGPHVPLEPAKLAEYKNKKSSLKPVNYPILVDKNLNLNDEGDVANGTNDGLLLCATITENAAVIFSSSERRIRGGIDILTFPAPSKREYITKGGRIKSCFIVIAAALDRISRKRTNVVGSANMEAIMREMSSLSARGKEVLTSAKDLLHYSKEIYEQWSDLLDRRSDFRQLKANKRFSPLYSRRMPENVTLYEDVSGLATGIDEESHGSLTIHWSLTNFSLHPDDHEAEYDFFSCPRDIQFELLRELIRHTTQILHYSDQNIRLGLETIKDPALTKGYETIQTWITDLEYDNFFDPLCALELRNALRDLVARKADLLNTSERALEAVEQVAKCAAELDRFAHQIHDGEIEEDLKWSLLRSIFCCIPKYVHYEALLQELSVTSYERFKVPIPLGNDFQRILEKCKQCMPTSGDVRPKPEPDRVPSKTFEILDEEVEDLGWAEDPDEYAEEYADEFGFEERVSEV